VILHAFEHGGFDFTNLFLETPLSPVYQSSGSHAWGVFIAGNARVSDVTRVDAESVPNIAGRAILKLADTDASSAVLKPPFTAEWAKFNTTLVVSDSSAAKLSNPWASKK
jgi:hypothetical protein